MQSPPTGRPIVIVLPFENIGGDPEQGYFADGLTADLVTDLTRFEELQIEPVRRARRKMPDPSAARGDSRNAARRIAISLFGGAVRRAGGRLRITVRLTDARTKVNLWAERFDRPLDDLFAVQEDLTNRIAAQVDGQVGREVCADCDAVRRPIWTPTTCICKDENCTGGRPKQTR